MRLRIDIHSIYFKLILLVFIITIVPVLIITFNTDMTLTADKNSEFKDKINDVTHLLDQSYQSKMDSDRMLAVRLAHYPGLVEALRNNNSTAAKNIIDKFSTSELDAPLQISPSPVAINQTDNVFAIPPVAGTGIPSKPDPTPNNGPGDSLQDADTRGDQTSYIITVVDNNGELLAQSIAGESIDPATVGLLAGALNGTEYYGTEILPASVIDAGNLSELIGSSGTEGVMAIMNAQPVEDDNGTIIGAFAIAEVLNNNNDLVNTITTNTNAYCAIIQNDTRISTSLQDESGNYLIGTREQPEIVSAVLSEKRSVEGIYSINNLTMYASYHPLKNSTNQTIGILFVGYNVGPDLDQLELMKKQNLFIALTAALLFVIIGHLMVLTITRPIDRIAATANSIAAGNLDTPVETAAKGGEIGELSRSLQIMLDTIVTSLKERTNFNESILKSISDPMLVVDNSGKIIFFNEPASQLTGYSIGEAIGQRVQELLMVSASAPGFRELVGKAEQVSGFEKTIIRKSGQPAIVMGSSSPVKDAEGKITSTIIILHDITWQKESEEQIKASLHEKEMLLKEIHHRVKNNLQIVSSLLNLQTGYIKDPQDALLFKESQDRVKSMAMIHEKLYQSRDIARINFLEYIRPLANHLVRSYSTRSPVNLTIDAVDASLEIDTAISCGLIVNEAITNSMKYAFPDGRRGEIGIELSQLNDSDNKLYRLTISDNGVGLPPGLDIHRTNSLGMQLIVMLTEQIHGTLEVNGEGGTRYVVTFRDVETKRT